MEKHGIDICSISETKKKGKGNIRYQNHILFYSGVDKDSRAQAGVGVLIHKNFENNIEDVKYINHNIMYITIQAERTHIMSIYAPAINKPKEERESFFDALQETH